ncbi:hypothetical protein AWC27_28740 [Mycobacterium szulgai]|uniref:Uncharacterized protein n=1 Tax=Mycobacterium szulgai TaxID=1787 RepID=A0A1X2EHY4_MYCSZ|nr:hypothetical protein AWC27_28740 [Mycobacterium szulgai]
MPKPSHSPRSARLVRDRLRLNELDHPAACAALRAQLAGADPEGLLLLDEMVGIRDPADATPTSPRTPGDDA